MRNQDALDVRSIPDGIHRTRDLAALGFPRSRVRRLATRGQLVCLARGLYTTPTTPVEAAHALAEVSRLAPRAIICTTSALQFHGLTTQNPWFVSVLLPNGVHTPRIRYPTLVVFRASPGRLEAGVEVHVVEGVPVRVTGVARTVADCFKYRTRVGLDIALEALREYLRANRATVGELYRCAQAGRVERVMRPYIESMLEGLEA
jgi:predicted transcriptional regulator of viral defense system